MANLEQDPDVRKENYKEALRIASDNGNLLDASGARNNLATILADEGNIDKAVAFSKEAINGFSQLAEFGELSNAYNTLGAIEQDSGHLDSARDNYELARTAAIQGKDEDRLALSSLNGGLLYFQTGVLGAAESRLTEALTNYSGKSQKPSDLAFANNALGDLYTQEAKFADARRAFGTAIALRTKLGESGGIALSSSALANLDLDSGSSTNLERAVREAIQQAASVKDLYAESYARFVLARVLFHNGNLTASFKEVTESIALSHRAKQPEVRLRAEILEAKLLAKQKMTGEGLAKLEKVLSETVNKYVAQNLEARLAKAELLSGGHHTSAARLLDELRRDSDAMGYKMIAQKAVAAEANHGIIEP